MKDEILVRLVQDACQKLEHVHFPVATPHLVPIYDALLAAAKANHPGDPYLSLLPALADGETGPEEMRVLLGQLRILLEALQDESGAGAPGSPPPSPGAFAAPAAPPPQER